MMFVSDRDFVFVAHKERVGKAVFIGVRSIKSDLKPLVNKVVRGEIAVKMRNLKR